MSHVSNKTDNTAFVAPPSILEALLKDIPELGQLLFTFLDLGDALSFSHCCKTTKAFLSCQCVCEEHVKCIARYSSFDLSCWKPLPIFGQAHKVVKAVVSLQLRENGVPQRFYDRMRVGPFARVMVGKTFHDRGSDRLWINGSLTIEEKDLQGIVASTLDRPTALWRRHTLAWIPEPCGKFRYHLWLQHCASGNCVVDNVNYDFRPKDHPPSIGRLRVVGVRKRVHLRKVYLFQYLLPSVDEEYRGSKNLKAVKREQHVQRTIGLMNHSHIQEEERKTMQSVANLDEERFDGIAPMTVSFDEYFLTQIKNRVPEGTGWRAYKTDEVKRAEVQFNCERWIQTHEQSPVQFMGEELVVDQHGIPIRGYLRRSLSQPLVRGDSDSKPSDSCPPLMVSEQLRKACIAHGNTSNNVYILQRCAYHIQYPRSGITRTNWNKSRWFTIHEDIASALEHTWNVDLTHGARFLVNGPREWYTGDTQTLMNSDGDVCDVQERMILEYCPFYITIKRTVSVDTSSPVAAYGHLWNSQAFLPEQHNHGFEGTLRFDNEVVEVYKKRMILLAAEQLGESASSLGTCDIDLDGEKIPEGKRMSAFEVFPPQPVYMMPCRHYSKHKGKTYAPISREDFAMRGHIGFNWYGWEGFFSSSRGIVGREYRTVLSEDTPDPLSYYEPILYHGERNQIWTPTLHDWYQPLGQPHPLGLELIHPLFSTRRF